MQKEDKERVVAELTERLQSAETLIVADYRGLTMPQIDGLRGKLLEHGARLSVVKNTLTRRAAEAAGADALLALLEGPSAIAFIESDGDPAAVAKALSDSARDTKILAIRGGVMNGRQITDTDVENLAKLPPLDVLRGQVLGVIIAPLTQLLALVNAPLQNLIGLVDARIEQLEAQGDTSAASAPEAKVEPAPEAAAEAIADEAAEPAEPSEAEPAAEAEAPVEAEAEVAADAEAEAPAEVEVEQEIAESEAEAEAPAEETDSDDEEA
jgi:large subunit ribosomal protein L10